MAVKLRLRRGGARNQPRYRIVAADSRSPRDGRFIEVIGHYNPTRQPAEFAINEELALKWLRRGAQPTETVATLLKQQGIMAKLAGAHACPELAERGDAPALGKPAPASQEAAPEAAARAPTPPEPPATEAQEPTMQPPPEA